MKRKIFTVLLAMIMLFSLNAAIFADPLDPLAPETGNLTIHKYLLEDIKGEAGGNGQGVDIDENLNYDANLADQTISENAIKLGGIPYTVYKIGDLKSGNYPAIPEGGSNFYYTIDSAGTILTVHNSDDGDYAATYGLEKIGEVVTDNDGIASFENLDRGYYLVVESPTDDAYYMKDGEAIPFSISGVVDPFVVAVPMTDPDGSGWIEDVHVYPKNPPLSIDKEVSAATVDIGDVVDYTLTIPKIPDNVGSEKVTAFEIIDILSPALDLIMGNASDIMISLYTKTGGVVNSTLVGAIGEFDPEDGSADYFLSLDGNEFSIKFTNAGREKLGDLVDNDGAYCMKVNFAATVNEDILDILDDEGVNYHTIGNTATVNFENDGHTYTDESNEVETDTGEIIINKTNVDGDPLGGAEFILGRYASNDSIENAQYYSFDGTDVEWLEDKDFATISTSDNTYGVASFHGIARDDNDGTAWQYFVIEVKAPENYNLLGDPVFVGFTDSTKGGAALSNGADDNLTATLTIVNTTEFTLPVTGGMGTIIFTIVGIVLVGLAVILIISTKKKKVTAK